ncbi:Gfo/Idh/MocA family protein [Thalassotalea sediminis]|uniref:Gfo/Idh/MocA family protein n=1 Tax=Thalassotalea sediminis TaxID=1759089 RepID=UPI002572A97C|nr:Gfo/Idh/MocA family oxidoreductase [Thalassotalea sediminis]
MTSTKRRHFLKSAAALSASGIALSHADTFTNVSTNKLFKHNPVFGLAVPKMETVRIGFIGVGKRGLGHVQHCCHIEGVEIKAICDIHQDVIDSACQLVELQQRPRPDEYTGSEFAYKDMLNRSDIDIIIISTPWRWHTPMAVDTMTSGKHAFVEVPAATTVEECWLLVNTAERTQKNCMMMENVCYGRDELMVLNMVRQGVFGELLHGEAAYIHDLRSQMKNLDRHTGSWRTYWHTKTNGNLYPTHGLGPISQYMNINRGDQFDFLTSTSSPAIGRQSYAARTFPPEHERNKVNYIAGDMNTTVIKTKLGRTITLKHDTTTPRPYTRLNYIQGTNGVFSGYPNRIALEQKPKAIAAFFEKEYQLALNAWETQGKIGSKPQRHSSHQWDKNMLPWQQHFDHPLWIRMGKEAEKNGGHGGMDFLMLWRMIYCLRNGEALDQNVYDAAAWSVIAPISADSVADRSNSKDIPDFTRGLWKNATPLSIVS